VNRTTWAFAKRDFVATAPSTVLVFYTGEVWPCESVFLDNVTAFVVPEPGILCIVLIGVVVLLGRRRMTGQTKKPQD
jgi:hypothetical protein